MGSQANPNPWAPYDSYRDCSQGICNFYCPQWCYAIFPPPPPSFFLDDDGDGDSSSSDFSPLLIALIGMLAAAFILVSYYTLISKFCNRRRSGSSSSRGGDRHISSSSSSAAAGEDWQGHGAPAEAGDGLDEALIKSIKVYKYRKSDGFVDCSDCSVCLSEFQENESLRLLPKCNHAFHVPCIDAWLKSHSNCPLCRANLTAVNAAAAANQPISSHPVAPGSGNRGGGNAEISSSTINHHQQSSDSIVIIADLESGARNESNSVESPQKPPERESRDGVGARGGEEETQRIRRSVSLNSGGGVVSIADILREIENEEEEEDEEDEESGGVGTSRRRDEEEEEDGDGKATNQRNGVSSFLVRSSMAMKRSVSTGRCILTRNDRARNYRLPS